MKVNNFIILTILGSPIAIAADNHWDEYKNKDHYPTSQLCSVNEITLWTCELTKKEKLYSLCSSQNMDEKNGYIQYRVSHKNVVEFQFPKKKQHPKSFFNYYLYSNGDASIDFKNGHYTYLLYDPLRSYSFISLSQSDQEITRIKCDQANQSLQLNYTMTFMDAAGVVDNND